jgi:hypothetical protein
MSYRDAFKSDRFKEQPQERVHVAQVFNPGIGNDGNAKAWGFGFEAVYASLIGFTGTPEEGWTLHEAYQFKDQTEFKPIYVNTSPSLVMVSRGDVRFMEGSTKLDLGFLRGHPRNAEYRANRANFKTYTRNLIFFVGNDNRLLHNQPLSLRLTGAAAATFADEWGKWDWSTGQLVSGFQRELLDAYWESVGGEPTPMGDRFFAYWVFPIQCKAQTKGEKGASNLVCSTVGHSIPTVETLEDFYINPESPDGQIITRALDRFPNFGKYTGASEEPEVEPPRQTSSKPNPKRAPETADEDEHTEVALSGRLQGLNFKQHPKHGLVAVFSIVPQGSSPQPAYAMDTVANHIQMLYRNNAVVDVTAIPTLDRNEKPLLKVTSLTGSVTEPEPKSLPEPEETTNQSDLISKIGLEMIRLGWSRREGSNYLQQAYGKKTRAELTEAEMKDFLAHLESQEAPAIAQ